MGQRIEVSCQIHTWDGEKVKQNIRIPEGYGDLCDEFEMAMKNTINSFTERGLTNGSVIARLEVLKWEAIMVCYNEALQEEYQRRNR